MALQLSSKSDFIGATASGLCLIHCIATPFLFVAQAGLAHGEELHPQWWGALDLIFLTISLLAIWWSSKNTSKNWMRIALWTCWTVLALLVLNEKLGLVHLMEEIIYLPAVSLVVLHLYNRNYCQCGDEACCAQPNS